MVKEQATNSVNIKKKRTLFVHIKKITAISSSTICKAIGCPHKVTLEG
jgi:hypothetical protein